MAGEVFPIGTVLFYVGVFTDNVTMVGWYVCDGSDSAPTIVNHFVRGAAASSGNGGSDAAVNITHTHAGISERPAHDHIGTTGGSDPAGHTHSFNPWVYWGGAGGGSSSLMWGSSTSNATLYNDDGAHAHSGDISTTGSHSHITTSSGAAGAGKNMPEYKRVIPIIRLA